MNKKVRRALLTVCGGFFLLVAPIVVLYAVGYRFVPSEDQARPVGVLLVDSFPDNAEIYIGNELVGETSKAVPGLSEGFVTVRLEKEGYVSWQKQLPIIPTRATEVRTVRLFAENPTVSTIAEDIRSFNLSPSRNLIAVLDRTNNLHMFDTQGEVVASDIAIGGTPDQVLWSPDSGDILIHYGSTYSLFSLTQAEDVVPIPKLAGAQSVVWDPRLPGRLLGLSAAGDLISYSTVTGAVQVLAADVDQFVPTSRHVLAVSNEQNLTWYSLQGDVERSEVLDMAIAGVQATPSGMLAVSYVDGSVEVITRDGIKIPVTDREGKVVGWSPDGSILLLQFGSSELQVFNVNNERVTYLPLQQLHTIGRLSRPINHVQWFAGGTHVVFQLDDEIVVSEVDTRDRPIQFTADSTNTGDAHVTVGEDGNTLLYLKSIAGIPTLVSRPLLFAEDI